MVPLSDLRAPAAERSLDPDSVVVNTTLFDCGGWFERMPVDSPTVVDVFFSDDEVRPTRAQLLQVRERGAEVGHVLPFQAVRIRIAPRSIPALHRRSGGIIFTVPDLRRHDWRVYVWYKHGVTPAAEAVFASLGGRITSRSPFGDSLNGIMPARSVPTLRRDPAVLAVEISGQWICGS